MLTTDDGHGEAGDRMLDPAGPRGREVYAGDLGQDVDPARGKADLNDRPWLREVGLRDPERRHRRAEPKQGGPHPGRVLEARVDPDVEVAGCPRYPVNRHRVCPHHQEALAGFVKGGDDVAEVLVQAAIMRGGVRERRHARVTRLYGSPATVGP